MNDMYRITKKGFKAFLENKDPEAEINHKNGWTSCAIGEYVYDITKSNNENEICTISDDFASSFSKMFYDHL